VIEALTDGADRLYPVSYNTTAAYTAFAEIYMLGHSVLPDDTGLADFEERICRAMVEAAMSGYGRLDILFNNVGISRPGTVVDVEEEDWDTVLDVNLKSMILTSGHAIPMMSKANGGAIVNVSSIDSLRAGWSSNIA